MSIFNATAPSAGGGGGLKEATTTVSSSTANSTATSISFTVDAQPKKWTLVADAYSSYFSNTSTSTYYVVGAQGTDTTKTYSYVRGGSLRFYTASGSSLTVSYSSNTLTFSTSSSYYFPIRSNGTSSGYVIQWHLYYTV